MVYRVKRPSLSDLLIVVPLLFVSACSSPSISDGVPASVTGSTMVNMHFGRASFYDAPFPSDDLLRDDGTVAIEAFPNPSAHPIVQQAKSLIASDARGFAESAGIFFTLTDTIDPDRLPDLATSTTPGASVFLIGTTPSAPDYLRRYPVQVHFDGDGGPFGAPNMLSLLPLQGVPLRPNTTYAAVVMRSAGTVPSADMAAILVGTRPDGMPQRAFERYAATLASLVQAGIAPNDIGGLAVFTTDDPTVGLGLVLTDMLSHPLPTPDISFHRTDLFDDFCVYTGSIPMPDYQAGSPPYDFATGGGWQFDGTGKPILQRSEEAGLVVTIPRTPMPGSGWPIVHVIRTGGGGSRPLVDRGPQAYTGGPELVPGTGPALWFARAGFAGASVDGPHEGLRNLTNANEDFLIFNVFNALALRDNIRESAAEYALIGHVLALLQLDVSDCPGTGPGSARFDATRMALMGHSMGAAIAPLVLQADPIYRAVVLSGAGASWIENIIWKQLPLAVRPAFELLLRYTLLGRTLEDDDPVLSLFQWAEEAADPLAYTRGVLSEPAAGRAPPHVLMEQGIVDHYIMPPIANAMSLSLGLDLAGTPLDAMNAEFTADHAPSLGSVLPFSGRRLVPLPASGNLVTAGARVSAVVVQHPSDGIEDGHEVVFQTDPPKREYRCFLETWAAGDAPIVPLPGGVEDPCQ